MEILWTLFSVTAVIITSTLIDLAYAKVWSKNPYNQKSLLLLNRKRHNFTATALNNTAPKNQSNISKLTANLIAPFGKIEVQNSSYSSGHISTELNEIKWTPREPSQYHQSLDPIITFDNRSEMSADGPQSRPLDTIAKRKHKLPVIINKIVSGTNNKPVNQPSPSNFPIQQLSNDRRTTLPRSRPRQKQLTKTPAFFSREPSWHVNDAPNWIPPAEKFTGFSSANQFDPSSRVLSNFPGDDTSMGLSDLSLRQSNYNCRCLNNSATNPTTVSQFAMQSNQGNSFTSQPIFTTNQNPQSTGYSQSAVTRNPVINTFAGNNFQQASATTPGVMQQTNLFDAVQSQQSPTGSGLRIVGNNRATGTFQQTATAAPGGQTSTPPQWQPFIPHWSPMSQTSSVFLSGTFGSTTSSNPGADTTSQLFSQTLPVTMAPLSSAFPDAIRSAAEGASTNPGFGVTGNGFGLNGNAGSANLISPPVASRPLIGNNNGGFGASFDANGYNGLSMDTGGNNVRPGRGAEENVISGPASNALNLNFNANSQNQNSQSSMANQGQVTNLSQAAAPPASTGTFAWNGGNQFLDQSAFTGSIFSTGSANSQTTENANQLRNGQDQNAQNSQNHNSQSSMGNPGQVLNPSQAAMSPASSNTFIWNGGNQFFGQSASTGSGFSSGSTSTQTGNANQLSNGKGQNAQSGSISPSPSLTTNSGLGGGSGSSSNSMQTTTASSVTDFSQLNNPQTPSPLTQQTAPTASWSYSYPSMNTYQPTQPTFIASQTPLALTITAAAQTGPGNCLNGSSQAASSKGQQSQLPQPPITVDIYQPARRLMSLSATIPICAQSVVNVIVDGSMQRGSIIGTVLAADPGANSLNWTIDTDTTGVFAINKNTGEFGLSGTLAGIDTADVMVRASNPAGQSCATLIHVKVQRGQQDKDLQTNGDWFSDQVYSATIICSLPRNSLVLRINARHLNDDILRYSLRGTDEFAVNASGFVTVTNLDIAKKDTGRDFQVIATDSKGNEKSALVKISLDISTCYGPQFDMSAYLYDVVTDCSGLQPADRIAQLIALPPSPMTQLTYGLIGGHGFTVDPMTGVITVINTIQVSQRLPDFLIVVKDTFGRTDTATVRVSVTLNCPSKEMSSAPETTTAVSTTQMQPDVFGSTGRIGVNEVTPRLLHNSGQLFQRQPVDLGSFLMEIPCRTPAGTAVGTISLSSLMRRLQIRKWKALPPPALFLTDTEDFVISPFTGAITTTRDMSSTGDILSFRLKADGSQFGLGELVAKITVDVPCLDTTTGSIHEKGIAPIISTVQETTSTFASTFPFFPLVSFTNSAETVPNQSDFSN